MCLTKTLMPILLCALLCAPAGAALAQATAFTYQGRLTAAGNPASGDYDLQFKLFDALAAGAQQGATLVRNPVAVNAGVFSVTLDFGANVFTGAARYLEIGVRPAGNSGPYTVLAPRQQITSTPYAIQTLNAMQLGGVDASRYVKTDANGNVLCLALPAGLLLGLTHGKAVDWPATFDAPAPKAERARPAASPTAQPKLAPAVSPNDALSISAAPAAPAQSGGSYNITQSVIAGGGRSKRKRQLLRNRFGWAERRGRVERRRLHAFRRLLGRRWRRRLCRDYRQPAGAA